MLKKMALKKIVISSLALTILLIICLFPNKTNYDFKTTLTYTTPIVQPIYLIDNNNYVARYNIIRKTNETLELVDYVIENLTISDKNGYYLPNGFNAIIPKNTKILTKSLEEDLLKINFSKEFLNIEKENEEKMLEAIVYSLLEIKGIKKIMIFVKGENLTKLPNSGKNIAIILDKNIGINKTYDINSLKETDKTTTYYLSKIDNVYYYVPVTSITNNDKEKVEIIIEKLKTSPTYKTNLISFLASNTELLNYEILENSVSLSFNNNILSLDNNQITEEVKYSIALSIRDTYNINQTIFYVDDLLVDAFNI